MILLIFFYTVGKLEAGIAPLFLRPQLALGNTTVLVVPCLFITSPHLTSHQSFPVIGVSVPPFAP